MDKLIRATEVAADDMGQMGGGVKGKIRFFEPAAPFDIDLVGAVHHDLRDTRFLHKRLQDIEAAHRVEQMADQLCFFSQGQRRALGLRCNLCRNDAP